MRPSQVTTASVKRGSPLATRESTCAHLLLAGAVTGPARAEFGLSFATPRLESIIAPTTLAAASGARSVSAQQGIALSPGRPR